MKKEIQSKNNNRNMATKSVPKSMQSILSALTDFVVEVVGDDDKDDTIRQAMTDHQDELVIILKDNMPVQKTSSPKKVKDPDAPKRGKSSYIYFCVEKRESIKEANPDMSAKDIIKELGRVWRDDVTDKDKIRYTNLSADDKTRYQEEMKAYTPPPNVGNICAKKTRRSGPKRGLTAYIFFCKEQRSVLKEEREDLSTKEVTAELGKSWRELSENDRKPYAKLAAKDKVRYENEKKGWVDPNGDDSAPKSKKAPVKTKKPPVKTKKASAKPRRKSGYILYCQELRSSMKEDHTDWTSQKVTKELGRTWNELDDDEQGVYNERANAPVESSPVVKSSKTKSPKITDVTDSGSESDMEELIDEEPSDSE